MEVIIRDTYEEMSQLAVLSATTLCVQVRQACSAGASPAGKGELVSDLVEIE
jgi:hypothetical protein